MTISNKGILSISKTKNMIRYSSSVLNYSLPPIVVVSCSVVVSTTVVSTLEDVLNGPGVEMATIGDTVNMIWKEVVVVVVVVEVVDGLAPVVDGVVNLLGTPLGNVMSNVGLGLG